MLPRKDEALACPSADNRTCTPSNSSATSLEVQCGLTPSFILSILFGNDVLATGYYNYYWFACGEVIQEYFE